MFWAKLQHWGQILRIHIGLSACCLWSHPGALNLEFVPNNWELFDFSGLQVSRMPRGSVRIRVLLEALAKLVLLQVLLEIQLCCYQMWPGWNMVCACEGRSVFPFGGKLDNCSAGCWLRTTRLTCTWKWLWLLGKQIKTGEVELRMQLVSKFERDLSISLSIPFFDVFCSKSAVTTWWRPDIWLRTRPMATWKCNWRVCFGNETISLILKKDSRLEGDWRVYKMCLDCQRFCDSRPWRSSCEVHDLAEKMMVDDCWQTRKS